MNLPTDVETARLLDAQDPLAAFRNRFVITDPDLIYLDGNSLGRCPQPPSNWLPTWWAGNGEKN